MLFYEPLFLFVFFPTCLPHLPARRAAGEGAAWRHPRRERAVLHLERAAVRAGGAGIGTGRSPDRAANRPPAAPVAASEAAARRRRADQSRDSRALQIHALSDREPERVAARHRGRADFAAHHHSAHRRLVHRVREDHLSCRHLPRQISRPAQRFATYLLYVFFFPKLLAGPIIKYHEMESQLRTLPAARFDDISAGFLRFMHGRGEEDADRRHAGPRHRPGLRGRPGGHRLRSRLDRRAAASPSRSTSISRDIPTWRSASPACSAFVCGRTSTCRTSRAASPSSGAAGTSR